MRRNGTWLDVPALGDASRPKNATGNVASDDYDGQFIGDHEYVEGAGDLDECNGPTADGQYGYYVTGRMTWSRTRPSALTNSTPARSSLIVKISSNRYVTTGGVLTILQNAGW